MRIRFVATSTLAGLAWAAALFAQGASGSGLAISGRLLSTGNASLVLRPDGRGEPAVFVVTTTTHVPPGLTAGNHVTVYYHAVGDRRVADRVALAGASARSTLGTVGAHHPG